MSQMVASQPAMAGKKGPMLSAKIGERFNWYHNPDALGFNGLLGTEISSSPATSDTSLYESMLLLKNARQRIQAIGL